LILGHLIHVCVDVSESSEVEDIGTPSLNSKQKLKVSVVTLGSAWVVEPVVDILVRVVELVGDFLHFVFKVEGSPERGWLLSVLNFLEN
jgi:hypothetical protein